MSNSVDRLALASGYVRFARAHRHRRSSSAHQPTGAAAAIGLCWDKVPGVTLLGDAAHLAPVDGEGVNLAMQDDAELGLAPATHLDDIETWSGKAKPRAG